MTDTTYYISHINSLQEYIRNEAFREILDTGNFLAVTCETDRTLCCYVIHHPKYVKINEDGIAKDGEEIPITILLTDYAKSNMSECCLSFEAEEKYVRFNNEYLYT